MSRVVVELARVWISDDFRVVGQSRGDFGEGRSESTESSDQAAVTGSVFRN